MNDAETPQEVRRQRLLAVLATVILIAAAGLGYWGYRRQNPVITPVTRKTTDFVVQWKCLACDNVAEQNAGRGPKHCPKCGKDEMYVNLRWSCPAHGVQDVAFQYDSDGQPEQIKMGKGQWLPAFNEEGGWSMKCPVCGGNLMPLG